jgi:hypothetical protein
MMDLRILMAISAQIALTKTTTTTPYLMGKTTALSMQMPLKMIMMGTSPATHVTQMMTMTAY